MWWERRSTPRHGREPWPGRSGRGLSRVGVDLLGGGFRVKILDFGLAKVALKPWLQTTDQAGGWPGSVFTMSLEQFEGKPLDGRRDLYPLGGVGYFALASRFPSTGRRCRK